MKTSLFSFLAAALITLSPAVQAVEFAERTAEGLPLQVDRVENPKGVVIMAHGCSGPLFIREDGWTKRLNAAGYTTVRFNSWTFRGMSQGVCQNYAVTAEERGKHDVKLAVNWSREQLQAQRIFVLGWSHGAGAALVASTNKELGLTAVAAMYPWCERWHSKAVVPTQIHMGSADDWTPAHRCRSLYKGMFGSSNPNGEYIEYEGQTHGFDMFFLQPIEMKGHW